MIGSDSTSPGPTSPNSGANTYTGTTTVTGGQLRLNTTGKNSIAGNLTVNAANSRGAVANVRLSQGNQIADTATVTMTAGILDMDGANTNHRQPEGRRRSHPRQRCSRSTAQSI